jgi:hypothetical protein
MNKYYDILGIDPDASIKEVKDAYRDLVKVWHPDRFSHDPKLRAKANGKLKSINEAYEKILSELDIDNEKRDEQSLGWTTTALADRSIFKSTPTKVRLLPGSKLWYLGLIIVGLSVLALIVIMQYVRRDDDHHIAIATSSPVHESSLSPTLTPTPSDSPSPKAEPSRDELDELLDSLPAAEKNASPPIDVSSGLVESSPTPTSTPTSTPTPRARTESLVSAYDVLSAGGTRKAEDTRVYRFRLQHKARVKGGFSARGNIHVEIPGGYYSSGGSISADTIDLVLESGVYELIVSARELVGFNVQLTAYYDQ